MGHEDTVGWDMLGVGDLVGKGGRDRGRCGRAQRRGVAGCDEGVSLGAYGGAGLCEGFGVAGRGVAGGGGHGRAQGRGVAGCDEEVSLGALGGAEGGGCLFGLGLGVVCCVGVLRCGWGGGADVRAGTRGAGARGGVVALRGGG